MWKQAFAGLLEIDLAARLGDIAAPALLIHGDRDALVTSAEQRWLLARLQNARLVTLEGTGHAPHWERPERFASELAAFVAITYGSRGASVEPREAPALAATTSRIATISRADEALAEQHVAGEGRHPRLERHEHAEDAGGHPPQRLHLERVGDRRREHRDRGAGGEDPRHQQLGARIGDPHRHEQRGATTIASASPSAPS